MRIVKESIEVGSSIQMQFQRSQLEFENIFKEFVDNSLQSFLDEGKNELLRNIGVEKCRVLLTIDIDKIVITDNSFGMDHESFKRALKLNEKSQNYSKGSLGEFGMGLKYAAISLGNEYTIESTALGSNEHYKATITRELLLQNSTTVTNEIDEDYDKNAHFTKITIKRLRNNITKSKQEDLIYKLSRIYYKHIEKDDLEIVFTPNRLVKYTPPEIWLNDDGAEIFEYFEGNLTFQDKTYTYTGWIGILKTARTSDAGFSLLQNDRIIVLNYRPSLLLGKPNSFPYQRIVGDINLDGWPVDFNKRGFSWSNGLEDLFLAELSTNSVVIEIIKQARDLRVRKASAFPTKEITQKLTTKMEKQLGALATIIKTPPIPAKKEVDDKVTDIAESHPLKFTYEGTEYTFHLKYSDDQDSSKKWLSVSSYDEKKSEYVLKINNNFSIFNGLKSNNLQFIQFLAIIISIAQLSTLRQGFKESHKFVEKINEVIKLIDKNEQ